MPVLLFVAFIVIPLVELFVIGQVSDAIGLGWTILLLVVDSLVGAWLVKREGRRAWASLRDAFESGGWPADEVAQGGLVIFGGALLLTPGFVTDALGLACVIPLTRAMMSSLLRRWTSAWAASRMGAGRAGATAAFLRTGGSDDRRGADQEPAPRRRPANRPPSSGSSESSSTAPDVEVLGVERDAAPED